MVHGTSGLEWLWPLGGAALWRQVACVMTAVFAVVAAVVSSKIRKRMESWRSTMDFPRRLSALHRRVGLVIAHPDDEAMFFYPTLRGLRAAGIRVCVLCLSSGNLDGQGPVRILEMKQSCEHLGVDVADLRVLDLPALQDGWHSWRPDDVAEQVLDFIRWRRPSLLLTFDGYGVSGHPNHLSTCEGVCMAHNRAVADRSKGFDVYVLNSPSHPWKYAGPLNLIFGTVSDDLRVFSHCGCIALEPLACARALAVHRSQFKLFRALSALFMSCTYANTFSLHEATSSPGSLFSQSAAAGLSASGADGESAAAGLIASAADGENEY